MERKTWDKEAFRERAKRRDGETAAGKGRAGGKELAPLRARTAAMDFDRTIGRTQVVQAAVGQPGFFCSVCDCVVRDSSTYLDHVNGKKHQRMLGMRMRVEQATVEQVRERLALLRRRRDERARSSGAVYDLAAAVAASEEADAARLAARKERRVERRAAKRAEEQREFESVHLDADVAAVMGFGAFGAPR